MLIIIIIIKFNINKVNDINNNFKIKLSIRNNNIKFNINNINNINTNFNFNNNENIKISNIKTYLLKQNLLIIIKI